MVTLDEAKRLKDAGFPLALGSNEQCRGYRGKMYTKNGSGAEWVYAQPCVMSSVRYYLPAPNSDELIAAIQERWNPHVLLQMFHSPTGEIVEKRWMVKYEYLFKMYYGNGATLLSALVDLYCKLSTE